MVLLMQIYNQDLFDKVKGFKDRHVYPLILRQYLTDIKHQWGRGQLVMQCPSVMRVDYEDDCFRDFYNYSFEVQNGVKYEN